MRITISLWWFIIGLPLGASLYLIYSDKGSGGYWNLPTGRTLSGCGLLLIMLGLAAGALLARCAP